MIIRKTVGGVVAVVVSIVAFAGVAFAQTTPPADPTNGAFEAALTSVQSFITDVATSPLFLLAATVTAVLIALRWVKKARSAAS